MTEIICMTCGNQITACTCEEDEFMKLDMSDRLMHNNWFEDDWTENSLESELEIPNLDLDFYGEV
jgi:hypothetical protein